MRLTRRVMNVGVVLPEERAYVLGLYFADGYLSRRRKSTQEVTFCLQGDEGMIAERVAELFCRSGLFPRMYRLMKSNELRVTVVGTNLLLFLPNKFEFLNKGIHDASVKQFISTERLDGDLGVPFIAGLLDGDGSCSVNYYMNRKCIFGFVCKRWSFAQTKFPFLVDFVADYAHDLAIDGASLSPGSLDGKRHVWILEPARKAFVNAGIGNWSFKVSRYLKRAEEINKQKHDIRSDFLKPAEVAKRLHVSQGSVRRWCKLGYVKHIRACSTSSSKRRHSYVIPEEEVSLLEEKALKIRADVKSKSLPFEEGGIEKWLTMNDASRYLECAVSTVSKHGKEGKIKFVPSLTLGGKKKCLIPTSELKRFAKNYGKRSIGEISSSSTIEQSASQIKDKDGTI